MARVILESDQPKKRNTDVQIKAQQVQWHESNFSTTYTHTMCIEKAKE